MSGVALSVVVPVYNEATVLRDLAARCVAAGRATGRTFEVILVDDASTDETPQIAAEIGHHEVRCVRLPRNRGQFRATQEGLLQARGRWVVVLDGDLQDPPETIPHLVDSIAAAPRGTDVVFAVKSRRDDPAWFLAGRAVFAYAQGALGRRPAPAGAGSYSIMERSLARRVALLDLDQVNLAAVLAALGQPHDPVPYAKSARYDATSRVGLGGLAREAVGSLLLTGALARLAAGGGVVLAAGAAVAGPRHVCLAGATALATVAALAALRRRAAFAALRAEPPVRGAEGAYP